MSFYMIYHQLKQKSNSNQNHTNKLKKYYINKKTSGDYPYAPCALYYLQLTKRYRRLIPHPEARIDRLTKRSFKLMNKRHGLRHIVKGKSASSTV